MNLSLVQEWHIQCYLNVLINTQESFVYGMQFYSCALWFTIRNVVFQHFFYLKRLEAQLSTRSPLELSPTCHTISKQKNEHTKFLWIYMHTKYRSQHTTTPNPKPSPTHWTIFKQRNKHKNIPSNITYMKYEHNDYRKTGTTFIEAWSTPWYHHSNVLLKSKVHELPWLKVGNRVLMASSLSSIPCM